MTQAPQQLGIGIRRHFTTPDVHPYDTLEWERRDSRIPNFKDGGDAFFQPGVEFPKSWSLNATNIVAQKYFRGTLGTPEREHSLQQVIDRVADTIADWGTRDGYFVDDAEAEAFRAELKHILVTQKAAFNSPVWFNIGVKDVPQQSSACFILAVDDTMDSILNWYREEGIIFKGGSGAGVNLSRIRSSQELLNGGGTASGPVSFMRGADASAGTIKSGGKTRRAAKMVILNADHPDVEEFVWCKAREERKARVLRDAGFDMDLDGADAYSMQYQNANNSVRVTDEFMQAVIDDADWELRAVTTGEVIKRMRVRELWREIAEAAWECADPGLQFDTTINRWHTAAATGPITASNPCSEYLSLDNSACNLASINLLEFLDDDDNFDIAGFRQTVEVVFTAQEILVGNSDYPTPKIAETTRAFRQLGLGYANLGALLMAIGLPYDSDAGRAWAAAITSLMTGHAYATSVRTASRMGPHAGYEENKAHMLRVLDMHRDAARRLVDSAAPAELVRAGLESWNDAVEDGARYGVRNSQASVLAPTGTISFMMDCDTTGIEPDLGLVKVKKLVGGGTMSIVNQTVPRALRQLGYTPQQVDEIVGYIDEHKSIVGAPHLGAEHLPVFACSMGDNVIHYDGHVRMMGAVQPFISGAISKCVIGPTLVPTNDGLVRIGSLHRGEVPDTFRDAVMEVASLGGYQKTSAFYYGGRRPVRRVTLRSGHTVTGTPNHRVLTIDEAGPEWKRLDEIAADELVAVHYGAELWSVLPARFDDFVPSPRYGNQKHVVIPAEMTEDLAFLLGAYAAEGCTVRPTWTVRITNSVPGVRERVVDAWRKVFGLTAKIVDDGSRCPDVVVSSKTVVEFLDYLGCGARASTKRIPDAVLRSPRHMVLAFLDGLSLDAYVANGSSSKWAICLDSAEMLDDLQAVLTNLGVVHSRISKWNAEYGKFYGEVYATGRHARKLCQLVPFLEPDKWARAQELVEKQPGVKGTADLIPIAPRDLHALIPKGRRARSDFAFLLDSRTHHVTRRTLERVAATGAVLPAWLQSILDDDLHLSPVESVADAGVQDVYDLAVPANQAFVANGIVNHNTVNMPEDVSVEDVEGIHMLSWELGLKAVAIYRDNCKVAQPLSTAKKGDTAAGVAAPAEIVERIVERIVPQPVRQKLPRTRAAKTFEFRVADCKGFVTIGEYADGRPGEIFLTVSKQGSTLSGIMDAFAKSISYGLQYGVPLRAFVEAFTNMRFEPAGMTDDPDIRFASSILDYLFRRLALEYLSYEERAELGIFSVEERLQPTLPGVEESAVETSTGTEVVADPKSVPSADDLARQLQLGVAPPAPVSDASGAIPRPQSDAPMCMQCGVQMVRSGACHVCPTCGTTSGCS
jgi:adenosylcobalamin-dependent ribonucleoside-diphosphate reductase